MSVSDLETVQQLQTGNKVYRVARWREAMMYVGPAVLLGLGLSILRPSQPINGSYQYLSVATCLRRGEEVQRVLELEYR